MPILEKCRLYILLLYRAKVGYLDTKQKEDREALVKKLSAIFEADFSFKQAFVHMSLLFNIANYPHWQNNLQPIFNGQILTYYKQDGKTD